MVGFENGSWVKPGMSVMVKPMLMDGCLVRSDGQHHLGFVEYGHCVLGNGFGVEEQNGQPCPIKLYAWLSAPCQTGSLSYMSPFEIKNRSIKIHNYRILFNNDLLPINEPRRNDEWHSWSASVCDEWALPLPSKKA